MLNNKISLAMQAHVPSIIPGLDSRLMHLQHMRKKMHAQPHTRALIDDCGVAPHQSSIPKVRQGRVRQIWALSPSGQSVRPQRLPTAPPGLPRLHCLLRAGATARLAQSAERKALNLVVVGSSCVRLGGQVYWAPTKFDRAPGGAILLRMRLGVVFFCQLDTETPQAGVV